MRVPLCTGVWAEQTRCATTILKKPTQKASENEKVPQSVKCLLPPQCQTCKTTLGQVNRKLPTFLRTFSGASLLDQGWKVQCRGKGICRCQHQHSGCGCTDHTNKLRKMQLIVISSIPPLFILESVSLKWGVQNRHASPCINLGMIIPSWTQMLKKLLVIPMLGTSTIMTLPQWDERPCSIS